MGEGVLAEMVRDWPFLANLFNDVEILLAASIRLRNPYIDPISLLQVDLLERWRHGDRQDDQLLHALVGCVNGVAQGLQSTG